MKILNRSVFQPRNSTQKKAAKSKGEEEVTFYIYDEIGFWGVDPKEFVKDLNASNAKTIHVRLNTPGGAVFDGTAIYNAMKQHNSHVVAHVDGLAASISSVIAMAADEVVMSDNAFMMIHDPWSIKAGNADSFREEADLLDKVGGTIANSYIKKTGMDESAILDLMNAETWMTAEEALEMGFIDSIEADEVDEKAKAVTYDLSVFANAPDELLGERNIPTARELEKLLKGSGFSNKQAKEILANGYKDDDPDSQRDAETKDTSEDTIKDSGDQRDADDTTQRDAVEPPRKKDRTAELLTRAELVGHQ